ncbi:histidine kinase N-terminal 7TM domain-containing protein [Rubrolithibacter danxiaensis]|uniref:histidine kinase N-terminal 7TM domain-containing protein n=1 Tax=Rubrolithibacter danxiaensis TaxID=3390805 RepID=UPI003BF903E0
MSLELNIYSIILLIAAFVTLFMALLINQRLDKSVQPFSFTMLAIAIWMAGYGLVLSSTSIEEILFWNRLQSIGLALLPALWILSIIKLINKERWLNTSTLILIFLIPASTLTLIWTDEWHHLYYSSWHLDKSGPLSLLAVTFGPWYKINTVYFYMMLGWGLFLLSSKFRTADALFRKQSNVIMLGALVPWVFNLFYQAGFRPYKHLDITPFTFILTSFIIGFGLLRLRLFDIMPIARERVIEAMQEGVLVLDKQNRVIDINPEMRKIIPFEKRDIIGSDFRVLFPEVYELNIVVDKYVNDVVEVSLYDGEIRKIYDVTITSLFEENSTYSGKILLFKDVTAFHAKEAINQLMNKKDEFLTIASHELKTPITSMKGYLQIIEKISEKEQNPAYRNFIVKANRQVDKLIGLISDLLDVSKIQAGKMQYNFTEFNLEELITDCITFSENNSPSHQIVVKGNTKLQVIADRNRIEQVLCNFLSNAVKYAATAKVVIIEIAVKDAILKISVTDFGMGISKEKLSSLFQKFYRIENKEQQISGLGIGLFICHDIVSRHGGEIGVESEVGKGSTFYFTLPLTNKTSFASQSEYVTASTQ